LSVSSGGLSTGSAAAAIVDLVFAMRGKIADGGPLTPSPLPGVPGRGVTEVS
jgi:hypothetical protein